MTLQQLPKPLQQWYQQALQAAQTPERQDELARALPEKMEQALNTYRPGRTPEEAAAVAVKALGSPAQFAPPQEKPTPRRTFGLIAAACYAVAALCAIRPVHYLLINPPALGAYGTASSNGQWQMMWLYGQAFGATVLFFAAGCVFLYQALRKSEAKRAETVTVAQYESEPRAKAGKDFAGWVLVLAGALCAYVAINLKGSPRAPEMLIPVCFALCPILVVSGGIWVWRRSR